MFIHLFVLNEYFQKVKAMGFRDRAIPTVTCDRICVRGRTIKTQIRSEEGDLPPD